MLLGGDEFGRTQGGNNNAWCQDSEISWFDWDLLDDRRSELLDVHPAADRAAPRRTPSSAAASSCTAREEEGSGLPDAWWFRADGQRMTERRLGPARRPHARDVPQRRGDRLARRARAAGGRRVVPAAVQRATTRTRVHAAARGASATRGRGARTDRAGLPSPATRQLRGGRDVRARRRRSLVLLRRDELTWRSCARPTGCSSAPASGFAQARALVPYLRDLGVSHLYLPPSFQARAGSTHGYDVVDPTRDLRRARRRGGVRRARRRRARGRAWGSCSTSSPTTWRPTTRNRYWADPELRAQFFDIDPDDRPPPALLRRRPPRRRAPGGPGGVRRDPRARAAAGARGRRRRAADRPSRRARRSGRLPASGCATAAPSTCGWRRSSTPASRCATGRSTGTVGYEFLNDVAGAVRRPGGRGAADRRCGSRCRATTGRSPSCAVRGQARAGARRRSRPRSSGCARRAARGRRRWSARSPSLPVYRTYVEPWSGRVEAADREAIAEAGLPASLARVLRSRTRRLGRVRHALPADDAAGDGQGRRGHGVLPLRAAAGAQRRRRRPGPLRASRSSASTRPTPSARERFPRNLLVTQTHDTKRSGDVRARIGALAGDAGRVGGARAALARAPASLDVGGRADPVEQLLHLPDAARRLADRRPSGSRRYLEKAMREAKRTRTGSSRTRRTRRRSGASSRALLEHRDFLRRLRAVRGRGGRGRRPRRARPAAAQADRPGRRPTSTRATSCSCLSLVDPDNRRPVDWERRRTLLDELRAGAEPTDETRKLWLIQRALDAARAPPGRVRGRVRAARRRAGGLRVRARRRGRRRGGLRGDGKGATVPLPGGPLALGARRRRGRGRGRDRPARHRAARALTHRAGCNAPRDQVG